MMVALVCGVGINDRSYPTKINGNHTKEYKVWRSMLNRVYGKTYIENKPSYLGCSVSDAFLYYHLFYNWCQIQIGFNAIGYDLDKDLLIKGNKLYSEDTCVFLPRSINSLLTKSTSARGIYPIGVKKSSKSNNFEAKCNIDGKPKYIGTYITPELAFQAYKAAKEKYIKEQAEIYKDVIDPRAYLALLNYEVDIDD